MRKFTFLLTVLILVFLTSTAFAQNVSINNQTLAENLHALNILKGSDKGFELDKSLTRIEGSVMMVRLLGKEDEAIKLKLSHPFTDVPIWASDYVGYLYHNNITNGISETQFGTTGPMSATQYTTFVLRALGYDDKLGEFTWDKSLDKAVEINVISEAEKNNLQSLSDFLRDDMVLVSHKALTGITKGSEHTLIEKLIGEGAVDLEVAQRLNYITTKEGTPTDAIEDNSDENITALLEGVIQSYYSALDNLDLAILQLIDTNNPSLSEESWVRYFKQKEENKERTVTTYSDFTVLSVDKDVARASLYRSAQMVSTNPNIIIDYSSSGDVVINFKNINGNWIISSFGGE